MPSVALRRWSSVRAAALDEVEAAHTAVGGTGPGRRHATRQLNHAYAVLLAAEFQGYCRELHTEAVEHFAAPLPVHQRVIVIDEFTWSRQLDRGNANPSALGSDFGRLGLEFWASVDRADPDGPAFRLWLEELNAWRNAIVHADYDPTRLGGTIILRLAQVRRWRSNCRRLVRVFDQVVADHLHQTTGSRPW